MTNEQCPKCNASEGYEWTWSKNFDGSGFATCKKCGAKFR